MPKRRAIVTADDIGDELFLTFLVTQSLDLNQMKRIATRDHADLLARQCELRGHPAANRPGTDNANFHRSADGLRCGQGARGQR